MFYIYVIFLVSLFPFALFCFVLCWFVFDVSSFVVQNRSEVGSRAIFKKFGPLRLQFCVCRKMKLKININDLVYYEVSCHVHEWNDDDKGWNVDDKGWNGGMTLSPSLSLSLSLPLSPPLSLLVASSCIACCLL